MKQAGLLLPIRVVSEANLSQNRFARGRRVKEQRGVAAMLMRAHLPTPRPTPPMTITMTRLYPDHNVGRSRSQRMDDDNLTRSLKATRDGIADALGFDDGDERVEWICEQRACPGDNHGVQVTIESCG